MKIIQFLQRQKELISNFRLGRNTKLDDSRIRIETFIFDSKELIPVPDPSIAVLHQDEQIPENRRFCYPAFVPAGCTGFQSGILFLHGLNERNWDKYLCWAEYLAMQTQKPVILFPLAYHINRAPSSWGDPRSMSLLVEKRKGKTENPRSLSFANAALSERLSEEPYRFFNSGLQTVQDIIGLTMQISNGQHPLFTGGASLDIFAYSIGSFLAEIILMANPFNLFTSSRLFVFCGGSIFRSMHGESRYIMDKSAYDRLFNFYCFEWFSQLHQTVTSGEVVFDDLFAAFNSMINPDLYRQEREGFFESGKDRIGGISLLKDKVMPWSGVEDCMGSRLAGNCFELIDFPYEYSHESPFPLHGKVDEEVVNASFLSVFQRGAAFLS